MQKKITPKGVWQVLKESFKGFGEDKIPKLSASLAYYTVFSLGPLLIVIIFLCGFFLGREAIEGSIYTQIKSLVGPDSAAQIQEIIKNASVSESGTMAATIGIVTLLIGATTVFAEIQDSINTIWSLKPKPRQSGVWLMLKNRLLSFGVIASLGFLLLVSLAVTAVVSGIGDRLERSFPQIGVVVLQIINFVLSLGITTLLFAVIFRVLPDAHIRWKDVWAGAIATSILFLIGKFAISFYIGSSEVGSTYGAAGSLVILLLWIYYSSIILYFGAEFTKAWAHDFGTDIRPNHYAVVAHTVVVETKARSLREGKHHREALKKGVLPTGAQADTEVPRRPAAPPPAPPAKELARSLFVLALSGIVGMRREERKNT